MLSPTKEKGPIIGGKKLSAFQNLLHRPRSHSWSHRQEKDKGKDIGEIWTYWFLNVNKLYLGSLYVLEMMTRKTISRATDK